MKKIRHSKTIWSNVILFTLLLIPELDHEFFKAMGLNERIVIMIVAILSKILVLLNILFRFETNQKLQYPK